MSVRYWLENTRTVFFLIALLCLGLLAFGIYLQEGKGLVPCPMCIVQRYCLILVMIFAFMGNILFKPKKAKWWVLGISIFSIGGAFVAARQSFLQWFPPEAFSCGRDFYGMVADFPLQKLVPMIFKGSGDCVAIDWTFLGLSIANWSFLNFIFILALVLSSWYAAKTRSDFYSYR